MAIFSRAHAIKGVLIACFLLLLLNFMNTRYDNQLKKSFSFSHSSSPWLRHNRQNFVVANTTFPSNASTVYTIVWNADKTFAKNVTYDIPLSSNITNNTHLLVDSTDFKRRFADGVILNSNKNNSNDSSNNTLSSKYVEPTRKPNFLQSVMTTLGLNTCPLVPPTLDGPIEVNTTWERLEVIEQRLSSRVLPGGWYHPHECNSRDRVAIIVPFRDRYAHLPTFLKNIHPFLMKQQVDYGIFLIEQTNGKLFNRAALMNVGFLEASKLFKWDCFIFHDIDLLPLDDRNLYTCPDQPRHMSVAVDIFGYKLPYTSIFGGVSAMTAEQFKKVNGFSNSFWGWGGEDDDMSNRLKHANFHISRYPINIARYMMLNHQKEKANPKRFEHLANGAKKFETDGLNSVKYEVYSFKKQPLFSWFLVELQMPEHR